MEDGKEQIRIREVKKHDICVGECVLATPFPSMVSMPILLTWKMAVPPMTVEPRSTILEGKVASLSNSSS